MRTTSHLTGLPAPVRDAGMLIARALLGVILIAHGWQKAHDNGIDATATMFKGMGVPAAHVSAALAAYVELIGGGLLILGLLTPIVATLLTIDMLGAWWFVHRGHGVFVDKQGWELVAALGLATALFALIGPGRFSLDELFTRRRRHAHGAAKQRRDAAVTEGAHVASADDRTSVEA